LCCFIPEATILFLISQPRVVCFFPVPMFLLALFLSILLLIYASPPHLIASTEISLINKTNLCENGGQLVVEQNFTKCQCSSGYIGENCQFEDPCNVNPCKNGGNCTYRIKPNDTISSNCSCLDGINCDDTAVLSCEETPCQNDGICVVDTGCICAEGFTGSFCEEDIDECQMDVCDHGKCINRIGTYSCECHENYYGKDCNLRNDGNNDNNCSCENGMRKNNTDDRCSCLVGYTGKCCEVDIDDCLHHQCQHGAICIDEIANYTCQCSGNYRGRYCEDVLVEHNQTFLNNYNSSIHHIYKRRSRSSVYCKILLYLTLVLFLITIFYFKYCIL
ncbi:Neurogenic locus Notch protein, partial [Trichinella pseudospiralis]